jgi:hypothetical protein
MAHGLFHAAPEACSASATTLATAPMHACPANVVSVVGNASISIGRCELLGRWSIDQDDSGPKLPPVTHWSFHPGCGCDCALDDDSSAIHLPNSITYLQLRAEPAPDREGSALSVLGLHIATRPPFYSAAGS